MVSVSSGSSSYVGILGRGGCDGTGADARDPLCLDAGFSVVGVLTIGALGFGAFASLRLASMAALNSGSSSSTAAAIFRFEG